MLKAVLFDLDGTVIINNEAYDTAFGTVLKQLGVDISSGFTHTGGIGIKSNWENLIKTYSLDPDLSLDELEKQTQAVYLRNIYKIKIRDGFFDLVGHIKTSGIKTALATGNDAETTKEILEYFEIDDFFDAISTVYESENPKPAPDIFLKAAEKLRVNPEYCVVLEDSAAGIEAAKRANMPVLSVHEHSFTDITVKKLQSLVESQ